MAVGYGRERARLLGTHVFQLIMGRNMLTVYLTNILLSQFLTVLKLTICVETVVASTPFTLKPLLTLKTSSAGMLPKQPLVN